MQSQIMHVMFPPGSPRCMGALCTLIVNSSGPLVHLKANLWSSVIFQETWVQIPLRLSNTYMAIVSLSCAMSKRAKKKNRLKWCSLKGTDTLFYKTALTIYEKKLAKWAPPVIFNGSVYKGQSMLQLCFWAKSHDPWVVAKHGME